MRNRIGFFTMSLVVLMMACNATSSTVKTENEKVMTAQEPIFEIAVRQVKEGMKAAFVEKRASFITLLKAQGGVSNDREFQSFYALPTPDEREVYIGMTQYASQQTLQKVQGKVMEAFMPFAQTMDLKAYVFVQPIEGGPFDLGTLATKNGQVLEVAVRRVKNGQEEAFEKSRKAFVEMLDQQEEVEGSWEFKVVAGQDTENLTVGMSVYSNQEAFQKIAASILATEEASAYFSTFEPVALQYAFSSSNQ